MSKLEIPKGLLPGFNNILKLSPDIFSEVVAYVGSLSEELNPRKVIADIDSIVAGEAESKVGDVVFSIGSLIVVNGDRDVVLIDLVDSYSSQTKSMDDDQKNLLNDRLSSLFGVINNIVIFHKINKLIADNDNIYTSSDIITDIRLVFDEDIRSKERGAIIIHRLKIEQERGYTEKETYFSLDGDDLIELRNKIDRALEKEENIKTDYSSAVKFYKI